MPHVVRAVTLFHAISDATCLGILDMLKGERARAVAASFLCGWILGPVGEFGATLRVLAGILGFVIMAVATDERTPTRCVEHARRWDWDQSVGPAHLALYTRLASGVRV